MSRELVEYRKPEQTQSELCQRCHSTRALSGAQAFSCKIGAAKVPTVLGEFSVSPRTIFINHGTTGALL